MQINLIYFVTNYFAIRYKNNKGKLIIKKLFDKIKQNPRKIISKDTSSELVDIIRSFPRQALHAHQISFLSKNKEDMISYEAPVPQDMQNLIENLKKL